MRQIIMKFQCCLVFVLQALVVVDGACPDVCGDCINKKVCTAPGSTCEWRGKTCIDGSSPPPPSEVDFNIDLVNMGTLVPPTNFLTALTNAKNRWESLIVGGLPDRTAAEVGRSDWFLNYFSSPNTDNIDDLLVGYEFINDSSSTLKAEAGVSYKENSRPIAGVIKMNVNWFNTNGYSNNDIELILLHTLGYIMWPLRSTSCGCTSGGNPSTRSRYKCTKATEQYTNLVSSQFPNDPIDLQLYKHPNGVCDSWNDSTFDSNLFGLTPPVEYVRTSEIMTTVFEKGVEQPLSAVTIGALDDLNVYPLVDYSKADAWPELSVRRRLGGKPSCVLKPDKDFDIGDVVDHVFD